MVFVGGRLGQVAGQQVVERGDVGAALDGAVPAHRHDHAAGPTDVAQQLLEDAGGANDLRAGAVLRPADGVDDGAGSLSTAVGDQQLGHADQFFGLAPCHVGNHLRRVAGEMAAEQLHHAAWVLQGFVAVRVMAGRRAALGFVGAGSALNAMAALAASRCHPDARRRSAGRCRRDPARAGDVRRAAYLSTRRPRASLRTSTARRRCRTCGRPCQSR